jgi:cytidylate kinase
MTEFVDPNTIIAIDGPAASGKTTLGVRLADCLGYLHFDTGVMYRAVTLAALDRHINVNDETAVTRLAEEVLIDVKPASRGDGRGYDVLLDGEDVTWDIRSQDVDDHVSVVSAYPGVRKALTAQQRRIGLKGHVVMVGRDIGTVVLPEAGLKVYLDASLEERARRRCEELHQRGQEANYEEILAAMTYRDKFDSSREVAPLKAAPDAIVVDTTGLTIQQVVDKVLSLVPGCGRTPPEKS